MLVLNWDGIKLSSSFNHEMILSGCGKAKKWVDNFKRGIV